MATEILNVAGFAAGTEMGAPIQLSKSEARSLGVHFNWSAALTASLRVEVSNDPALHGIVASGGDPDTLTTWVDYSSEVTLISPPAGGAERNGACNASFFGFEWVRFGLVWSAGTADVIAWAHGVK